LRGHACVVNRDWLEVKWSRLGLEPFLAFSRNSVQYPLL
jgi:hypothetical protein